MTGVDELLAAGAGLAVGALIGGLRPGMRRPLGIVLVLACASIATVVSGEYRVSLAFVVPDIAVVAVSAVLGMMVGRALRSSVRS